MYSYSIEFVTSTVKVLKSLTFDKVFFMFDSQYKLNIQKLYNKYKASLEDIQNYPLESIKQDDQKNIFGCNVDGHIEKYVLRESPGQPCYYLLFYQCKINNISQLKVALLTISTEAYTGSSNV